MITEAPLLEITTGLLRMPYFYKLFHIISEKKLKNIEKGLKPVLEGKLDAHPLKFFKFRQRQMVLMTKNKRYPNKYSVEYDFRQLLANTRKGTPVSKITAFLFIGKKIHAKVS